MQNKKGVSLIVVLLFMLVATIAATATYRWITSEERSSASRMLQEEAYQSAVAGIESARSWMAYHANDVGALIKQYKDGDNKPLNLTSRFAELAHAGQNYEVWLVGANTENTTYKLKILAEGRAREGAAKHKELAILNVDGLYQVFIPQAQTKKKVSFDYAYFGGSYLGAGNVGVTSAVINGNWKGNPQSIEKNFVVTGNAELSGSDVYVGKLACVGGNLSPQNQGIHGGSLYVGGIFNGNLKMTGDVYFDGKADTQEGGDCAVAGNVMVNGLLKKHSNQPFRIAGNLCTSENGLVISETTNGGKELSVAGNVWMPGDLNFLWADGIAHSGTDSAIVSDFWNSDPLEQYYYQMFLGTNEHSQVYIRHANSSKNYNSLRSDKTFTESADATNYRSCLTPADPCEEYGYWGWGWKYCKKYRASGACSNWSTWNSESYSPLPEKNAQDDKYYVYFNQSGVLDVEFKSQYNDYWKENTPGYFVGGAWFFDLWNVWNEYQFRNDKVNLSYKNGKVQSTLYCKKQGNFAAGTHKMAAFRPVCYVAPWFKSNGHVISNLPMEVPFECADKVKEDCDSIWKKKPGCDGSSYKVDDVLTTGYSKFASFSGKGCAAGITSWSNDIVSKLNACYKENNEDETLKQQNLYNGFLVVEVNGGTSSTNPGGTLDGKFIIIANDKLDTQLPKTTEGSHVFLFLKQGASNIKDSDVKNYFIYTEQKIENTLNMKINGTIYATAETCAGMGTMQSSSITYNPELVQELTDAGIICDNDGSSCGGVNSSSSSSGGSGSGTGSEDDDFGHMDAYYVATSPQLGVTVESQYRNNERLDNLASAVSVDPSFIVLPRVVYLTQQAPGKLEDYYGLIPLNGRSEVQSPAVTCDNEISPTGLLYDGTNKIPEGYYTCRVMASVDGRASTVPFYVVVKGSKESSIYVSFKESSVKVAKGASTTLSLVTSALTSTEQAEYEVTILKPSETDGWTVTPLSGVTCSDRTCKVKISSSNPETPVFNVTSVNGTGSMTFFITESSGCLPGTNPTETVLSASFVTIVREDVSKCALPECGTLIGDDRPNCNSTKTWFTVTGTDCSVDVANEKWSCGVAGDIMGKAASSVPTGCEVIIPPVTLKAPLEENSTQIIYASLKAKKSKLTVKFSGKDISGNPGINVTIYRADGSKVDDLCSYDNAKTNGCEYSVYTGESAEFALENGDDKSFNYWSCEGGNCPTETLRNTAYSVPSISVDNTVIAHFNENDDHCFFDEFTTSASCESTTGTENAKYCISAAGKAKNAKWYVAEKSNISEDALKALDYSDGHISLRRGIADQVEANKPAMLILSSADAGIYGTLTAQFLVPKAGSGSNKSMAGINNSGFVLRSNTLGTQYLILNVFTNSSGDLTAKVCVAGGACLERELVNGSSTLSVSSTEIVTMQATLAKKEDGDHLNVKVVVGYSGSTSASADFNLLNLKGAAAYANHAHQSVGFALSHPNFKLYDIGWTSEDYGAECWDTPPTVKCSFRAAYVGGIVPKGTSVKPWVGYSSWFNSSSCSPTYWYNGKDACGGYGYDYTQCSSDYNFSEDGAHGFVENDKETKMAKVSVASCGSYYLTGSAQMAQLTGEATCGAFWVGEQKNCFENVIFMKMSSSGGEEHFVPMGKAITQTTATTVNLRDATLRVELDNPLAAEVHISLYSENGKSESFWGYDKPIYADPFVTNETGVLTLNLKDIENTEGFDIENIRGILVRNMETGKSVTVKSITTSCEHMPKISNCKAEYKSGFWNISATMKNAESIVGYKIQKFVYEQNESTKNVSCTNSGCKMTGDVFVYDLEEDMDSYAKNLGKPIYFKITPNMQNGAIDPCETERITSGEIKASCSINKTSVVIGEGIPVATYSLSGCPDAKCGYEVSLGDVVLAEATGGDVDKNTTNPNKANAGTQSLAVGEYSIKMRSTNSDRPFNEVECGKFEVTEQKVEIVPTVSCEDVKAKVGEKVTITPSVTGCDDGCSYTLTGIDPMASGTLPMTGITYTAPSSAGSVVHSLTVTNQSSNRSGSCSFTGVYEASGTGGGAVSMDCEFAKSKVFPQEQLVLNTINIKGITENKQLNIMLNGSVVKTMDCGYGSCWNNQFAATNSLGTHTYEVMLDGYRVCSAKLEVQSAISCDVSSEEIGLGESVTITGNYLGSCWNVSVAVNNSDKSWPQCNSMSYTETPTALGTYEYKIKVNGNPAAECSKTVKVVEKAPTITCPDNAAKKVGSNISVKPKSLSGCSNGCEYNLSDGFTTSMSGYSYKGDAISFTAPSYETSVTYQFEVKNDKGAANCNFTYDYKTSSGTVYPLDLPKDEPVVIKADSCYSITSSTASCTNIRFNCLWNNASEGCSIQVNSNSPTAGGHISSNNILSPKPNEGDVICTSDHVDKITCAGW